MQTLNPASIPVVLPETVDFVRQVELNRTLEGVYPLSKFTRLGELLLSDEGFISVKLEFGQCVGFDCLRAQISAKLQLECQRCLDSAATDVSGSFKFALVRNEEESELLPEELEPYLLEGDEQSIIDLVEDELLLCLPMVTTHEGECSDFMSRQNEIKAAIEAEREADKKASHPFAALQALKDDLKIN
ncbi:MAG: DUF177 domain-containing protein [Proteobacteria bacterium]|nr:DUF177 domain-containing protein [Pseudomonadota bacterium]